MKFISTHRLSVLALSCALLGLGSQNAFAQAVPTSSTADYTADQLEKIVGPIALYPDDLISITLPSSTYPLDLVKAQRFLDKQKTDKNAKPDPSFPDPVLKLLNYPDIIKKMNEDLDWTQSLGEAVDTDEAAVLAAIQAFRRKVKSAGNLKSDDKQVIVVEKEVIVIKPADPQVIYVPTYQPSTVVVYSSTPYYYGYYPTPYPSYYYPYAPGAAFATGLIFGAAIGGAWNTNWGGGSINHNTNININNNNINNINSNNRPNGGNSNWRNGSAPSQTKAGAQNRQATSGNRPGDARPNQTGAASNKAASRPSTANTASRNSGSAASGGSAASNRGGQQASRDSAFNGVNSSGSSANRASNRGASSMSSASARSSGKAAGAGRSGGGRSGGGRR
ncbi:DUF3300 domain-containing protein [Undibacterium sp. Ren11W]|uniref:DUF3300 domain-containing protein n=1 Tax=Undibacterium sp. Ren11W TaxID=3413045 RepID=UPI003BF32533